MSISVTDRRFEVVRDDARKHPGIDIILPTRGSKNAAGYDFYLPESVVVEPHKSAMIWLDVKVFLHSDEVLLLFMRSSLGKKHLLLTNMTGIIDSDYYGNVKNDGNIGAEFFNYGNEPIELVGGDRLVQGVVVNYLTMPTGNTNAERTGGFGSTNR